MLVESTIIVIYSTALILIFMYALAQLNLLFNYLRAQKSNQKSPKFDLSNPAEVPFVTIQLPVFNELYVMDRLLENIVELDYPNEKLEIQVLDDSTDESVTTTANQIKRLQEQGYNIQHIRRENRKGFKAGALKELPKELRTKENVKSILRASFTRNMFGDLTDEKVFNQATVNKFNSPKNQKIMAAIYGEEWP